MLGKGRDNEMGGSFREKYWNQNSEVAVQALPCRNSKSKLEKYVEMEKAVEKS